jgi:hypothetical protein
MPATRLSVGDLVIETKPEHYYHLYVSWCRARAIPAASFLTWSRYDNGIRVQPKLAVRPTATVSVGDPDLQAMQRERARSGRNSPAS